MHTPPGLQRGVRIAQLEDVLDRAPGRPEAALLAEVLRRRRGSTLTLAEGEELFLKLIRAAGLPEPDMNVPLCGYVADAVWREHRVVFEIDGYGAHSTRVKFNRDRRKDAVLKAAGWDPNRLGNDQLEYEPYAAVAYVAQALARARARRAG